MLRHRARHAQLVARRVEPRRPRRSTRATSTSPTTRAQCTRSTRRPARRSGSRTSSRSAGRAVRSSSATTSRSSTSKGYAHLLDRNDGSLVGRVATDGTPATAQPARIGRQRRLAEHRRNAGVGPRTLRPRNIPRTRSAPAVGALPGTHEGAAPGFAARSGAHHPRKSSSLLHAAHSRPRRAPERRQVDAVQPADPDRAPRSSPTSPGLTRDRHYGRARVGERPFLVVDTGGFEPVAKDGILYEMAKQTRQAIAEADVVVFLVDARQGLTPQDRTIADLLRRSGRPVVARGQQGRGPRAGARGERVLRAGPGRAASDLVGARRQRERARRARAVARARRRGPTPTRRIRRARRRRRSRSRSSAGPTSASRRWSTRCSARSA